MSMNYCHKHKHSYWDSEGHLKRLNMGCVWCVLDRIKEKEIDKTPSNPQTPSEVKYWIKEKSEKLQKA